MERRIEHVVRLRAGGICEYCRLPESVSLLPFPLDHIIARQHRGDTTEENLALSCPCCNQHKGPNIAGLDPGTQDLTRLFNPRRDEWLEHFRWEGALIVARTAVGRTTQYVLALNDPDQVRLRELLIQTGLLPQGPIQSENRKS
jgi:hypothetical protein